MARGRFHLTFHEQLATEPVVHTLGKRFDVVTTIRRASIEERFGWIILEIEGAERSLADAVAWLGEHGVQVERIDGEGQEP